MDAALLTMKATKGQSQLHLTFCVYSLLHQALNTVRYLMRSSLGSSILSSKHTISVTAKHKFLVLPSCKIFDLKRIRNVISLVPERHFLLPTLCF